MSQLDRILLAGGPFETPRVWPASAEDDHVKVEDSAGYDHFAPTEEYAERGGELMRVYRWIYRTFVAE